MTSAPIVAFVGAGNVLPAYLDAVRRLEKRGMAVVGPVLARRPERAAELKARFPDLSIVSDLADMLAQPVDVAVVLTPPAAHPDHVRACLHAGFHVLSEKPLAGDLETARRLFETADGVGRHLVTAPFCHLSPTFRELFTRVNRGEIGTVHSARTMYGNEGGHWATWYRDGSVGPLGELGIYSFRTLTSMLGPVSRLFAVGRASTSLHGPHAGAVSDPSDIVQVILEHHGGPVSTVLASQATRGYRRPALELYGTGGTANLSGDDWAPTGLEILPSGQHEWRISPASDPTWHWTAGLPDLVEAVRQNRPPTADRRQDLHLTELVTAGRRSAATGRPVDLQTTHDFGDLSLDLGAVTRTTHDRSRAPEDQ